MTEGEDTARYFDERRGCPWCDRPGSDVLATLRYRDTAEANRTLPDIEGKLWACGECGVAFPSHSYEPAAFHLLYAKTWKDLDLFDRTVMQTVRKRWIRRVLRHRDGVVATALDALSAHALQIPLVTRRPHGLRVLDVGCGFGEWMETFQALGATVVGTEIVPAFVERLRPRGFDVRLGELESLDFDGATFDVALLRAVFYRTRDPGATLEKIRSVLARGGEIALLDPCPGRDGVEYFFRKQFPQGQFYILDPDRYLAMLESRFRLRCTRRRLIYGRPTAPLSPVGYLGNVYGLAELMAANLLHRKPYMLNYNLQLV